MNILPNPSPNPYPNPNANTAQALQDGVGCGGERTGPDKIAFVRNEKTRLPNATTFEDKIFTHEGIDVSTTSHRSPRQRTKPPWCGIIP